jgi:hypothetical protein
VQFIVPDPNLKNRVFLKLPVPMIGTCGWTKNLQIGSTVFFLAAPGRPRLFLLAHATIAPPHLSSAARTWPNRLGPPAPPLPSTHARSQRPTPTALPRSPPSRAARTRAATSFHRYSYPPLSAGAMCLSAHGTGTSGPVHLR